MLPVNKILIPNVSTFFEDDWNTLVDDNATSCWLNKYQNPPPHFT
jgi:hypothetical protein